MSEKDPQDKHLHAYQRLLNEVKSSLESLDEKSIHAAYDDAVDTLKQIGELSHDEIECIADYVKRDIAHGAQYLKSTGQGFKNWFAFDWALIEGRLFDAFMSVADKTQVDQQALDFRLKRGAIYKTGEIIGLGTLQCDQCGELLHFEKISHIPPCPKCKETAFSRV